MTNKFVPCNRQLHGSTVSKTWPLFHLGDILAMDSPQVLNKIVFAGEAILADAIAAFKGTIQPGALRRANVGSAVMAVEAFIVNFR